MAIKKKKILLSSVFLLAIISVTSVIVVILVRMGFGISSTTNKLRTDLATDDLVYSIIDKLEYASLSKVSSDNISKYYDIDENLISDAAVYISNKDEYFSEVSCFRLKNNDDYPMVETAIKNHLNFNNVNLKDLNPQENKKLKESKIEYCEPYVLVIVADNSDSAAKIFRNMISGKSKST